MCRIFFDVPRLEVEEMSGLKTKTQLLNAMDLLLHCENGVIQKQEKCR